MIKSQLVDQRNWCVLKPRLLGEISKSEFIGFDLETEDSVRHDGLNNFMKGKNKLVFDVNRTTICGFSWYCKGSDTAYYLNLNHADVENRIPWSEAKQLLDAKKEGAYWIAHNAPFELTMMRKSLGYELGNVICTLQMAVSHHNEDQYPIGDMLGGGLEFIQPLLPSISKTFSMMEGNLTGDQTKLLGKVIGKTTQSSFSYNHLVRSLSYGYGLKKLTKQIFRYDQTSFKTVLGGREHMGQLTGDEVCAYGADDSYWAIRLFDFFLPRMAQQNKKLLTTFFEQENPMIHVFADVWSNGLRLDAKQVLKRRNLEREAYATSLRGLHKKIAKRLPFKEQPNQPLMEDAWYAKNYSRYRNRITKWATTPLPEDIFKVIRTASGAVSNAWGKELGLPKSSGPNFSHYMITRTLLYDLEGLKIIKKDGKTSSDAAALASLEGDLIESLQQLSGIEQRMKLYLTPYLQLLDPETDRVYPVISSKLNSRRMAMSHPNGMQLAKRGESKYVRGFFLPDEDDHVIISVDWSQVELVEIGDFSEDPSFAEAYAKLPFKDLHWKAVGDMFETDDPKSLPDAKNLRTKVGKGANFNYWYSGALSTVGIAMGWTPEHMWDMTAKYRETFKVAEQWRVDTINDGRRDGFITLPDGHRRCKFEATHNWQTAWQNRFDCTGDVGLHNFGKEFVRAISNRSGNQLVNSMIQGSCATLAKRSILAINAEIKKRGLRARFLMPIHDELVFSVHKDDALETLHLIKRVMCHHPDIIQHLTLDATASIGRTFEPYHPEKAPLGQIELDEAPKIPGWLAPETEDTQLSDKDIQQVINYLFKEAA